MPSEMRNREPPSAALESDAFAFAHAGCTSTCCARGDELPGELGWCVCVCVDRGPAVALVNSGVETCSKRSAPDERCLDSFARIGFVSRMPLRSSGKRSCAHFEVELLRG